jgi:hypothetical protein
MPTLQFPVAPGKTGDRRPCETTVYAIIAKKKCAGGSVLTPLLPNAKHSCYDPETPAQSAEFARVSPMSQPAKPCSRRCLLTAISAAGAVLIAAAAGCSSSTKKKARNGARPKGPKTMGNLLVDGYIADLKKGPAKKQIAAAKELGNMGASAKSALPALESLVKAGDAQVRDAARQAIKAIRK